MTRRIRHCQAGTGPEDKDESENKEETDQGIVAAETEGAKARIEKFAFRASSWRQSWW